MNKRKLLVSGNKANLVCIPKTFVERNELESKQDLYITDLGRSIIIDIDPPIDNKNKEIFLGKSSFDEILLKLKALYQSGYKDIEIILPDDMESRNIVEEEISLLWGITYIKQDNRIIVYSEEHQNNCDSILKKCFEEVLYIATHLTEFVNTEDWYNVLKVGYRKAIARIDFVFRLLHTNTHKCIKMLLKNHSVALILQLIIKSLFRIAKRLKESEPKCSVNVIKDLLNKVYHVCFYDSKVEDVLNLISEINTCNDSIGCWLCSDINGICCKSRKLLLKMIDV